MYIYGRTQYNVPEGVKVVRLASVAEIFQLLS